jgi:2-polyprenyl-3-methyl-5-hydroxy-6-metoxy-1,4-benzoquinol methylase
LFGGARLEAPKSLHQYHDRTWKPRLLILIVACNAQKTINTVVRRIPCHLSTLYEVHILIIDDASPDSTFAESYGVSKALDVAFPVRILFNPVKQGYGGNQKLGYQYALENDFDFVALLNGDGEYPPESLPEMLLPLQCGAADVVFGSPTAALRKKIGAGRRLCRSVVNRLLTWTGNRLLRAKLSDFHCGYRVYSVSALSTVPFERNSNDFRFDTEIVIQLLIAGRSIRELPIPEDRGDDLRDMAPVRCSIALLVSAAKARLQEVSLFYDRRFDCAPAETYSPYTLKLDYESPHRIAFDGVKSRARVLDLGCAGGYLGSELRLKKQCRVTGIDTKMVTEGVLDEFHIGDLNDGVPPVDARSYDVVLLLDVVEHLHRPELFLEHLRLKMALNPSLELMVSTGNIACFVTRAMLLIGQFNYGMRGILDITHTRLFTFASFRRALVQAGFDVLETKGIPAPYPLAIGDNFASRALIGINRILIRLSRRLFSYQIFMRVKARPSLELLLAAAERESGIRASLIELGERLARAPGVHATLPRLTPPPAFGLVPISAVRE